ncbi:hypothetical protein SAMN05443287_102685 [Micromonospora phaseoli]|uniref:Uncharacterized protein n=1 Tax=Micromonospora phaseoli TaxID=1144548 RepID=A0A1H6VJD9_9ACTN|nr:hypothetical protein [Micromonospora phaseoli]PZV93562.1 hypothetical protein CLV64_10921 [Micromonospora phaseoli]GIJ80193.1 hypothetical protein Xph01_46250 [Micromonospora phaseoli]SEJ03776.1 hypothetical protein SAMN05443287_102685 [Micromonospora phaseoli]
MTDGKRSQCTPGYDDLDHFREIGGDEQGDTPFVEYLKDWPG